uniref:CN hydrolase domain-containing protein n=2 Tax=Bionectria ochroleuca TaxID=29856 RepID=A0A0B7KGG5_BIOOC
MRIGCLQFAPQVGDVDNNLTRADEILANADPEGLDLLVLPELAFSGYNFKSLQHISPYLESPASGISSLWSRSMALKYDCTVVTGYPERVDTADSWPADPEYYNSALVISDDGETVANYRKANLYYTDVTWALEGPDGFYRGRLPNLGPTAIGICMDLNPYKFEAPWDKFEFAHHVLNSGARLVIVSMAWSTYDEPTVYNLQPQEPDTSTLMYWISRFEPVIQARLDEEIIIVFANRSGMESEALYTGTSTVVGIKSGEVRIYGILGRCDNELLVVDTDAPPFAKLVHRIGEQNGVSESCNTPSSEESDTTDASNVGRTGGSLDGTSRESPSRESRQSGSTSNHAYKKSSSFSRRDDLSINVSGRPKGSHAALESPFVHTPTAPSPTPYQIRPQLFMPSDDSRLQQFIELNSSPNPQQTQASINEPKADEQDLLSVLDSSWLQPGSRGSVSSTCSSLQYWMPSARPNGLGLSVDDPAATHHDFEKGERERSTHRTPRVDVHLHPSDLRGELQPRMANDLYLKNLPPMTTAQVVNLVYSEGQIQQLPSPLK